MKIQSTQLVLDAARDLHALRQKVTRESLRMATGLTLHIIDERIRVLINDERMVRVDRGEYEPVNSFRDSCVMSKTITSDGLIKYEIGDQILELTPHEDRMLSELTAGALVKLIGIEGNQQAGTMHSQIERRVRLLERIQRDNSRRSSTKRESSPV